MSGLLFERFNAAVPKLTCIEHSVEQRRGAPGSLTSMDSFRYSFAVGKPEPGIVASRATQRTVRRQPLIEKQLATERHFGLCHRVVRGYEIVPEVERDSERQINMKVAARLGRSDRYRAPSCHNKKQSKNDQHAQPYVERDLAGNRHTRKVRKGS